MAAAKMGDTVKVHYTGKLEDGSVFDSSAGQEPLEFTLGEGQVIPGFEEATVGMNIGESRTTSIAMKDAYGPRQDELVIEVDRGQLPEDLEPEVGQQLQAPLQNGETIVLQITAVSEASVTLDGNHPLAGKDLTFEIELVEIA